MSSTPTAPRWQGLRAQRGEHLGEPVDAAAARRLVALVVDPGADELEVEAACVAGCQHVAEDALEGDVAVAGDEPVRRRERPDREVADLDEPQTFDARRDRAGKCPLGPAR